MQPAVIYLHGLGSSPGSPKATLFADHFGASGFSTIVPDLSLPTLRELSVFSALEEIARVINEGASQRDIVIIASSFGGFLTLRALSGFDPSLLEKILGVALLAPVLYPWHGDEPIITAAMERAWRETGVFPIEEGASGTQVLVHQRFLEELKSCAGFEPSVSVPTLVLHGVRDERVPYRHSVEFVSRNPQARLVSLDEDHQMMSNPRALVAVVDEFVQGLTHLGGAKR